MNLSNARRGRSALRSRIAPTRTTAAVLLAALAIGSMPAHAASRAELERDSARALQNLYATNEAARQLGRKAVAILVFPNIVKAGFMFAGQIGEGTLQRQGRVTGYYRSMAASYGFQAGAQKFGYAMFFMSKDALKYLEDSNGWEVGSGPSLVVVDEGMAKSLSTTTLTQDVYAFVFSQKGLMGGIGIQGTKITKIEK